LFSTPWLSGLGFHSRARTTAVILVPLHYSNGVVAIARQNTLQNGRVCSRVSVAAQFLGIQYGYGSFNLGLCFWLFFPYTVWALLVGPAHQIRSNRVRNPAS
jgi:hypothetical protein